MSNGFKSSGFYRNAIAIALTGCVPFAVHARDEGVRRVSPSATLRKSSFASPVTSPNSTARPRPAAGARAANVPAGASKRAQANVIPYSPGFLASQGNPVTPSSLPNAGAAPASARSSASIRTLSTAGATGEATIASAASAVAANAATSVYTTSDSIQTAVNQCSESCTIQLGDATIDRTIELPFDKTIRFVGFGTVKVTAYHGFVRRGNKEALVSHRIEFANLSFEKNGLGHLIWDDLDFNSKGNQGISVHDSYFSLNGGSVGIVLSGDMFSRIENNSFLSPDRSATAISTLCDGEGFSKTPMQSWIVGNSFYTMKAFRPENSAACLSALEGFHIVANSFYMSPILIRFGNLVQLQENEINSSLVTFDSNYNSNIQNNYFDDNADGTDLLLVTNTYRNVQALLIQGNHFDRQGSAGTSVRYVNAGRGFQTTNVTMSGNMYVGGDKTATVEKAAIAIEFGDETLRNLMFSGENFFNMYSPMRFTATVDRSTIDRFEARDVKFYAIDLLKYAGNWLRADALLLRFHVDLMIPMFSPTNVDEPVYIQTIAYPQMFTNPEVYSAKGSNFRKNFTFSVNAGLTSMGINLIKKAEAMVEDGGGARAMGSVDIVLDGTKYYAPR